MRTPDTLIGLPWQQAKSLLQAASIPFNTVIGESYAKRFSVADAGLYVARATEKDGVWHIVLFYPMIYSEFENHTEVQYAEELLNQ